MNSRLNRQTKHTGLWLADSVARLQLYFRIHVEEKNDRCDGTKQNSDQGIIQW